jgi:hypothetical protein
VHHLHQILHPSSLFSFQAWCYYQQHGFYPRIEGCPINLGLPTFAKLSHKFKSDGFERLDGLGHSYDILGAGMLWKPKKARKFVKIR